MAESKTTTQHERLATQLDIVCQIAMEVAATTDVNELLERVVTQVCEHLGYFQTGIALIEGEWLSIKVVYDPGGLRWVDDLRLRVGKMGITGRVAATGRTELIPDVRKEKDYIKGRLSYPLCSELAVPLKVGERVIGVLNIESQEVGAFNQEDVQVLESLAGLLAVALEQVRLIGALRASLKEQRWLQEQLIQAEKYAALGDLVAGMAHEINNPLAIIMGYTQLLSEIEGLSEKLKIGFNHIEEAARRCQVIIRNLVEFSRYQPVSFDLVSVNEILKRILETKQPQMQAAGIKVEVVWGEDLPPVSGDHNQLMEVFLHLINNAQQAMQEQGQGGLLRITTSHESPWVRATIQDTGPGISPGNLKRIFNPFFSTKPVGQGSGLGLWSCYNIVTNHRGTIQGNNNPDGPGACFVVDLPHASEELQGGQ